VSGLKKAKGTNYVAAKRARRNYILVTGHPRQSHVLAEAETTTNSRQQEREASGNAQSVTTSPKQILQSPVIPTEAKAKPSAVEGPLCSIKSQCRHSRLKQRQELRDGDARLNRSSQTSRNLVSCFQLIGSLSPAKSRKV
jgi:hypothetical protein